MPLELQRKYLDKHGISGVQFLHLDSVQNLKENSFLISNYAFSEISMELQNRYTNAVLNPYVSHGFLCWNFIEVYKFIENKQIISMLEFPVNPFNTMYVYVKPY
jgi:hypothetical protein